MKATKQNNFLLALAAFLVIALGFMSYLIYNQDKLSKFDRDTAKLSNQSSSDETDAIEKDLNNTKFDDLDKENADIDKELNSSY